VIRGDTASFQLLQRVRIKQSSRLPNAGKTGIIFEIDSGKEEDQYLVRFPDGLVYRYVAAEMEYARGT
jgi:hypothetical protein